MEQYKPIKLDMEFSSRSVILKLINKHLCSWGQVKTPKNKEGEVIGTTSALWLNESTFFYKCFSALVFIICILFVACYIFLRFYNRDSELSSLAVRDYSNLPSNVTYEEFIANSTVSQNSTELDLRDVYCTYIAYNKINSIFVLIGAIILFINFTHAAYLGCFMDYASDQEWSRNLSLNSIIWVLLIGFIIADYIYSASLIVYYNDHKGETTDFLFNNLTPKCKNLFQANMYGYLIVAILSSVLAIFQIFRIIALVKKYFLSNYVEHTARCEDENILVMN